jgi:hypothetical protein
MRSLLARHRRGKTIDSKIEMEVFATFQEDIRQKFLICHPFPGDWAIATANLLSVLHDIPVKTLDALHLMIAKDLQADILATSDHVMARGAKALGFSVVQF